MADKVKFKKLFGDKQAKVEAKKMMESIAQKLRDKRAKNQAEPEVMTPATEAEMESMSGMAMQAAEADIRANPGSGGRIKNMVADEMFQKNQDEYLKRLRSK